VIIFGLGFACFAHIVWKAQNGKTSAPKHPYIKLDKIHEFQELISVANLPIFEYPMPLIVII